MNWMSLEDAERMAAEIAACRREKNEHKRPDVLRREDAIVVLWQALLDERARVKPEPCSRDRSS